MNNILMFDAIVSGLPERQTGRHYRRREQAETQVRLRDLEHKLRWELQQNCNCTQINNHQGKWFNDQIKIQDDFLGSGWGCSPTK